MWFFVGVLVLYVGVLSLLFFHLRKVSKTTFPISTPSFGFSIIVPYRNEATCLPLLFESLLKLDYPASLFEIIFVNDHSEDDSHEMVKNFSLKNSLVSCKSYSLPKHLEGKKAALQVGIENARHPMIITTDADCIVPSKWLWQYNSLLAYNKYDVLIGGVVMRKKGGFLPVFQYYDFLALQAVGFAAASGGYPILCNGANFCYAKQAFLQVKGFEGNQDHPSGDDIFLLSKFYKQKYSIGFLAHPENSVITHTVTSYKELIQQRIRWFSKAKLATSWHQSVITSLLLLANFSMVLLWYLTILNPALLILSFVFMGVKMLLDGLFLYTMASAFKSHFSGWEFILVSLVYPFALLVFIVFLGRKKIHWKARSYTS